MSYVTRYWIDGRGWAEAEAITFTGPQADLALASPHLVQREIPTYASGLEGDGPIGPHRCPRCRQIHRDPTIVCAVCREKQTARRHSGAACRRCYRQVINGVCPHCLARARAGLRAA